MTSWSVLVLDDQAESDQSVAGRRDKYRKLEEVTYDHRAFRVCFGTSADHARALLREGSFDLVLLDVNLSGWGDSPRGTVFGELLELAGRRFPIGLVSANWDQSSMGLVREQLERHPNLALPLLFTFRDFADGAFAAICTQIVSHVRRVRSAHRLDLAPSSDLRILHMSDFHFGASDITNSLASEENLRQFCDRVMSECEQAPPHIVCVTGDIGNTGHPEDYEKAGKWFKALSEMFGWTLPSPRIMLVPGNHDYSVPLSAAKKLSIAPDRGLRFTEVSPIAARLDAYAVQPFRDFAKTLSGGQGVWARAVLNCWAEFGFAEYGVVFSGFGTSVKSGDSCWPERSIDSSQISAVKGLFRDGLVGTSRKNQIFHVSLSHHSPVGYPRVREAIEDDSAYIESFLGWSHGPELVLHGHQHQRWGALPNGPEYFVVCAPTPTRSEAGRPADSPRGANLITLTRLESVVREVKVESLVRLEAGWTVLKLPNVSGFRRSRGRLNETE